MLFNLYCVLKELIYFKISTKKLKRKLKQKMPDLPTLPTLCNYGTT